MQSGSEFTLILDAPAFVRISTADGSKSVEIDVYTARRILAEAESKPTEEERWQTVMGYLAAKLECDQSSLSESVALGFNNYVCAIVNTLDEERKKKAESIAEKFATIASSLTSTPASPATSAPGRQTKKKRGLKTSPA